MLFIRSFIFTSILFLSVAPYALLVLLARPFGREAAFVPVRAWVRFNYSCLKHLCHLDYEVVGKENIPDEPCVVYIKHSSAWETLAQLVLFGDQSWVLKRELLWIPVFGWALWAMNPTAIDRGSGRRAVNQVLEKGKQRLDQGMWFIIFPEGTRLPAGTTRRYGMSGALLAKAAGKPVLPVAHNAGDFWPRHGLIKKPGRIQVVIGPPIASDDKTPEEINRAAQTWTEGVMREISGAYGDGVVHEATEEMTQPGGGDTR